MLLPAPAVAGPEFVTLKSAPAPLAATPMLTVAKLLLGFVSLVVVPTETVSVMIVPVVAPAATV